MTLRQTFTAALLAAPLALAALPGAQAAPWSYNYTDYGTSGQGTLRGPNGQRIRVTDTQIGPNTTRVIQDNYGNRVRCTTTTIGTMVNMNCN
ncbi:MAG: hypothetical protein ACKOXO_06860 [Cyanobium sp.]